MLSTIMEPLKTDPVPMHPSTTHFFLNYLIHHMPSKISSFAFTFALDTHVRIVIPEAWGTVKVT